MAYFGNQSNLAVIARSTQLFAPIQTWANKGWDIFAGPGSLWGASGLEVPLNVNTAQYQVGNGSIPFAQPEAEFTRYPVLAASAGAIVYQTDIDREVQAKGNGGGLDQFFAAQANIGTTLTMALEQMVYTGDRTGYVPGFLGSRNTMRYVAASSVMAMTGVEFYNLIARMVAKLVAENPNIGDGGITISIPTPYISKLSEYITVAGGGNGATPVSNTVEMAIKNLQYKPRVIYHKPALGSVYAMESGSLSGYGVETGTATDLTVGNMCIYVGLNTPTVCGIGADISMAQAEAGKVRRLMEEFNYSGDGADVRWSVEDIFEDAIKEGGEVIREQMDDMRRKIVDRLRGVLGAYSGVAPENILPVQLLPWVYSYEGGRDNYKTAARVYTAGGVVGVPNMMLALDTGDAVPDDTVMSFTRGILDVKVGDAPLGATAKATKATKAVEAE
ncbi:MAG: hypothetical protein NC548_32335 [Lachnospiraceae bacterium]|nr:hypothetical protein [Lachnospiraceae bacterium]